MLGFLSVSTQCLTICNFVQIGLHLRDCLEELVKRKLRDLFDFDWQKCGRFYITQSEGLIWFYGKGKRRSVMLFSKK